MLIRRLPPESATATSMRVAGASMPTSSDDHDVEIEQWSRADQLLAAVRDELQVLRYLYERSHTKGRPKWRPTPTPRPGVKPKRKRPRLNANQVVALEAHLARTQGAPDDN